MTVTAPTSPPTPTPAPSTAPAAKAWAADFYAGAESAGLPLASLLAIVASADTADAAQAGLAAAVAAKATPPAPEAPPAPAAKAWAHQFFAAAEKSGLGLAALNGIVAKATTLDGAKDALIDAMASGQSPNLPAPNAGQVGGGSPAKDDKAAGILASYRKAGGRTRGDAQPEA